MNADTNEPLPAPPPARLLWLPPPAAALLAGGLMAALSAPVPAAEAWRVLAVAGLAGLALLLMLAAAATLWQGRTTINPLTPQHSRVLMRRGVYALSRNPIYLADLLALLAWALWLGKVQALLGPVLFVLWMNRVQIRAEEWALQQRFGADYTAYRARVRRWL